MTRQAEKYNRTLGDHHKAVSIDLIEQAIGSLHSFVKFQSWLFVDAALREIRAAKGHWVEGTRKHREQLTDFLEEAIKEEAQ